MKKAALPELDGELWCVGVPPGEDNNIYCKFCYHRKFAPVGYRQYTYLHQFLFRLHIIWNRNRNLLTGKLTMFYFRGAGCADWVDGESNNVLRHSFQAFNILLAFIAWTLHFERLIAFSFQAFWVQIPAWFSLASQDKNKKQTLCTYVRIFHLPNMSYCVSYHISSKMCVHSSSLKNSLISVCIYQLLP